MKPGTKKRIPRVFVEYIDLLTFSLSIEILLILSFHNKATKSHSLLHNDAWLFLWKEYGAKKSSFNKASFRRAGKARVQSSGFLCWIKLLSNFWKVKAHGNGLPLFGHESNFTNLACTKLIKKPFCLQETLISAQAMFLHCCTIGIPWQHFCPWHEHSFSLFFPFR